MNAEAGGTFTDPGATVADNVDQDLVVTITGTVDTNKLGDYVLQYTAKDKSDNVATSVTRTITVVDTTAPVITLLGEATLTHEGGTPYTDAGASVTDNLDTELSATVTGSIDISKLGEQELTYDAMDSTGNKADTITRKVTVVDTAAPAITLNGEAEVTINESGIYTEAGATALDAVDGDLTASIETSSNLNADKPGTYSVTYDVSDATGNKAAQAVRTVVVLDITRPVITLKGEAEISLEAGEDFVDPGTTVTDNVDDDLVAVATGAVDNKKPGTYTITYTATDSAGNEAIAYTSTGTPIPVTRSVIVVDTTAPVITLLGDAEVGVGAGAAYTDPGATAADIVDGDLTDSISVDNPVDFFHARGLHCDLLRF